jgi:hypothetical protein
VIGENAHVRSRRPIRWRQIRALVEKEFTSFPTERCEISVAALEHKSERRVKRQRSVQIPDHHLDYELISEGRR